ncbi:MAG: 16S rRNA (uracil(1498)-N(3))-methyltransferase [Pseudomonadota bacterium]
MPEKRARIRLFVDAAFTLGGAVALGSDQAHYLVNVMRQGVGDLVLVFNGRDGEWMAEIVEARKRGVVVALREQTRSQAGPPDVELLFAPIKKARTDFIVEKAAEMGVRAVRPVFTRRTNAERIRLDKLRAHAVEAAEQCGGMDVPEVLEPIKLDRLIADWPGERKLMFCDETMQAPTGIAALHDAGGGPWSILIGPEGGFDPAETEALRALPQAVSVTLGPRILRADTAAVAALTLWHAVLGGWAHG